MTRFGYVLTSYVAALGAALAAGFHPEPRLIWNASASVPIGLYYVRPAAKPHVGDLLVIKPPALLASFLAARHYLPIGVPLLKRVAAGPGQSVCRIGRLITIDGAAVGEALDRDRRGRVLPIWRGCRRIRIAEVFVMNAPTDSLDGRYFGPLPATTVVGRADPIWTRGGR